MIIPNSLRAILIVLGVLAIGFILTKTNVEPAKEAQFLFPPTCHPVPEEQATICMSWEAFSGQFVEVNRFPWNKNEVPSERGS